jgi:hypothetical protein
MEVAELWLWPRSHRYLSHHSFFNLFFAKDRESLEALKQSKQVLRVLRSISTVLVPEKYLPVCQAKRDYGIDREYGTVRTVPLLWNELYCSTTLATSSVDSHRKICERYVFRLTTSVTVLVILPVVPWYNYKYKNKYNPTTSQSTTELTLEK